MCCWSNAAAAQSKWLILVAHAIRTAKCTRTFNHVSIARLKSYSVSRTEPPSTCGLLVSLMNSFFLAILKSFSSVSRKLLKKQFNGLNMRGWNNPKSTKTLNLGGTNSTQRKQFMSQRRALLVQAFFSSSSCNAVLLWQ